MSGAIVLCTDGSDASIRALKAGLSLLAPSREVQLVTVIEAPDPSLVTGTGFAGGTMSPAEFDEDNRIHEDAAAKVVHDAAATLGLADVQARVLHGMPGAALCDYAAESSARAACSGREAAEV